MSGHEWPGCLPESMCDACTAEVARLAAAEARSVRLAEALRDARMVLPMWESGFGIEKAKRILDAALAEHDAAKASQ